MFCPYFGTKANVRNISVSYRSGETWPWLPTHTEHRGWVCHSASPSTPPLLPYLPLSPPPAGDDDDDDDVRVAVEEQQDPSSIWRG